MTSSNALKCVVSTKTGNRIWNDIAYQRATGDELWVSLDELRILRLNIKKWMEKHGYKGIWDGLNDEVIERFFAPEDGSTPKEGESKDNSDLVKGRKASELLLPSLASHIKKKNRKGD